jgi:cytochrome c oxidase assembly factor CtaG
MTGIFILILATFSPLEFLGQYYLLSAHMTQHVLLLLVIPPLLLSGTNPEFIQKASRNSIFLKTGNIVFYPIIAWFFGVGSMWVFHIPNLVMAIHGSMFLMTLQMVFLLVAGLIFIWPVLTPLKWKKLEPLPGSVYLFLACVCCTILGILIVFAPAGMFNTQMSMQDPLVLDLIQQKWGITQEIDQQAGGLIMWVPTCIVYLTIILISLLRWFMLPDSEEMQTKTTKT